MRPRARAIIIKDDQVLLMHRIKDGREYYAFPGGGIEEGETPEETVAREIKEELTLDVKKAERFHEFENRGDMEYFLLITEFSGTPVLSGEEVERMNENNVYDLKWIKLSDLKNLENLFPEEVKEKIIRLLIK